MAVLGRLLVGSSQRLDLPDFLSIDSFSAGDFKYLIKSFVGEDKPFILKGFDVIRPEDAIGAQNISIRVSDSAVYCPDQPSGPFFYGLEEGNLFAEPLVPELRNNAKNYVYLTLTTTTAAKDTRAFWDVDGNSGAGAEFTQDVNTQTVLQASVNVSVSAFPEGSIPVCIVEVTTSFITKITDARDMMFRLGSGGLNPDPLNRYSWKQQPAPAFDRLEPNSTTVSALDPNPFQGGDKNINSLKEWMDAVMSRLAELGGTTYWYQDTSTFNLINIFKDALATSIKSKGTWASSAITPGSLTWSEDISIQSTADMSEIVVRAGTNTLDNNQVLYIEKIRNAEINSADIAVDWLNSVDHVNGQIGAFENLSKGDWVKKATDSDALYLRVEEFYSANNKGGGVTAPGNARSIKLSAQYGGLSESSQARYQKGIYLSSEVQVDSRSSQNIQDTAANFYWLALRSDTILDISEIETIALSLDITRHDSVKAEVDSIAHGLQDGQKVTISGSINFDGTYVVAVENDNKFFINIEGGPFGDELGVSAFYALVTTAARSTVNGLQLESASHGLRANQKVIVSDTTSFNGSFDVFPISSNQFTIPFSTLAATENSGLNTVVNIYVRTDVGPTKLERGEEKAIGEMESEALRAFIGIDNDAQMHPNYKVPSNYNAKDGEENFNSLLEDNLTTRVSKLTAMMADKAQDKTIIKSITGASSIVNIEGGVNRVLSFVPAGTFTAIQPNSAGNTVVGLGGSLTLAQNEIATYTIDRDNATNIANISALEIHTIERCPLEENRFVFAYRLNDNKVYLYDGSAYEAGVSSLNKPYTEKVNYIDLVSATLPSTATVTADGQSIVNGNLVLFAELSVDPGVYVASNIGVAAEWTKVLCFAGGSTPLNGSTVSVLGGTSYFKSEWRFDGNRWKPLDGDIVAKARTGFPVESRSNSDISFDDLTRTFAIEPSLSHFDIYQSGVPYRFDSTQTIVIPDTEGSHFVYFNNGILTSTTSFNFNLIEEWVYVANIYWDADNQVSVLVGDERHGLGMDAKTHEYLHNINGTQISSGFALGNFTIAGDGDDNIDAQISIANGTIVDEDISHKVVNSASPNDIFEQILDPVAKLPVWHRDGASGFWRREDAIDAPLSVGTTAQFNEFDGSSWQLTDATDGNYIAMWVFATNDVIEPIVTITGQNQYATLGEAQESEDYNSISFGTMPAQEFKVLYRLIYQTDSAYTNDYKTKLVDIRDLRKALDTAAPAYAGSYHGSLSGLTDKHHPDFSIFVNDPSTFSGAMTPSDDDVEKALKAIDPWFRQLRAKEHLVNKKRVTVSAADALRTDGTVLSQVVNNLLLKFDGAEIDFSTGFIYEADGITSLGIDFVPVAIPAGEWQWYSLTIISDDVNTDNTINGQIIVIPASGTGVTKELAPKAQFVNGTRLALVAVQEDSGTIADIFQEDIRQLGVGSGGSGGAGEITVTFYDPVSTDLPSGPTLTIDGISAQNRDTVIFANLSNAGENNKVYEISGVGSSIEWRVLRDFNGEELPAQGDSVRVRKGDAFGLQLAIFDGTTFKINDVVRYFDGVNFWEQSSLKTAILEDASLNEVFTINNIGSQNIIVDYSISRGSGKRTGALFIVTDGLNASLTDTSAYISEVDVEFEVSIQGSDLVLEANALSNGNTGSLKYSVKRWSDSTGGPTGIPNYSSAGSSNVEAAGSIGDVQFKGPTNGLAGDSRFKWNSTAGYIDLDGLKIDKLSLPINLLDNQVSPAVVLNYNALSNKFAIIEYSIERDNQTRLGKLLITTNGSNVAIIDDFIATDNLNTGVTFSANLDSGDVRLLYISTSTGFNASFKCIKRRWN